MGCCSKALLKKKIWSRQEDSLLINYITKHGAGQWRDLPKKAGLKRCGKSCRFRWLNYLRPDIKRGSISPEEEDLIMRLHRLLGNRWSLIAGRLPGRTDNEIKNLWNTRLKKRLLKLEDTGQDTHTNKLVRPKAVRCIRAINIPYPQNPHSHEVVLKKKRVEDYHQITRSIDEHMNDVSAEYWVDVLMGLEQDGSCSKVVHVPNSQDPHGIFFGEHLSTHDLGFGNEAYGANMVDTDSPNLGFWRDKNDDDNVLSKEAMDFSALLSSFLN